MKKTNLNILFLISGLIIGIVIGKFIINFNIKRSTSKHTKTPADTTLSYYNNKISSYNAARKNQSKEIKKQAKKGDDTLNPLYTTNTSEYTDSANNEDGYYKEGDDVYVMKDILLLSKKIELTSTGKKDNAQYTSDKSLDSLLLDGDGKSSHKKNKNVMDVEFWQSPVNYKGYKATDNKLILFGIFGADSVSLYNSNDSIFMKYLSKFYIIEKNDEFSPLKQIKTPYFIKRSK